MDVERLHGDPDYFDRLVRQYSARIFAFVRAHAEDDDVADDRLQETWLRAYRARHDFHGRGSWLAWLLAICRSVCMDGHRRGARDIRRKRSLEAAHDIHAGNEQSSQLDALVTRERTEHIMRALMNLPDRQRETVILRLVEGRSTKESALLLECAEGTVRAALHAGVAHLRSALRGNDA